MYVPICFVRVPYVGIDRYIITTGSSQSRTLPDLMRVRYYFNDRPFVDDVLTLPKLNDMVEFDYRVKEWFIVHVDIIQCI